MVSVRDEDTDRALGLLSEAETTCRAMNLSGAPAYNHKMRGNVLYRAGRYEEARALYERALAEFRAMSEPQGEALARLGLAKSLARLGLRHAREMVARAREELGAGAEAVR